MKTEDQIKKIILELASEDAYGSWELWRAVAQDMEDDEMNQEDLKTLFLGAVENLIEEKQLSSLHYSQIENTYTATPFEKAQLKTEIEQQEKLDPETFYWFETTTSGAEKDREIRSM
jgi:hypothetical protein